MTDPEFAHRTYIEPITPEVVEKIIIREQPDALLPTLGGQTALNTAMALFKSGVLDRHHVRMIGANADAIDKGEDRLRFKEAMLKIGLDLPLSGIAHTMEEAKKVAEEIGRFPLIIRPAFTLGGQGGGIAYNREEFEEIIIRGLDLSPVSEVLIEESLLGWKEFEMEVMRDRKDNCVVICSIENLDPMGVHTGDSITVAPIQTLTDREYQIMRDASFACIREIGVETGGSNIQFATDPKTGRMIIIEMNPRVSRSSALASKATGFPIAKIAAKLAVGYTLDELPNDITRETPASFEPTIDYVVTKVPRFTFEKFPTANPVLTTSMKSVGEAMSIGRTFKESMQKCLRSLETGRWGFGFDHKDPQNPTREEITRKLQIPNAERIFWLQTAFINGWTIEEVHAATQIDPWFLGHLQQIAEEGSLMLGQREGVPPVCQASTRLSYSTDFHPFTPDSSETEKSRRHLPHWEQENGTLKHAAARRHATRTGRPHSLTTSAASKNSASPTARSPRPAAPPKTPSAPSARPPASSPPTAWSIPAPRSSRPTRRISTRPMATKTKPASRTRRRSSSSAAGLTESARASSSTTAASTPPSR